MIIKAIEVGDLFKNVHAGTLLLVDVDDTLITPCSTSFREVIEGGNFIDEFKKMGNAIPNFEELLGKWRLRRKVQLVEKNWPQFLSQAQKKGALVVGLTKMHTGKFGPIPNMENWRLKELQSLGLTFTQNINNCSQKVWTNPCGDYGCFKEGIIFTGPFRKGEVLKKFLKDFNLLSGDTAVDEVIMVDDRMEQVQDINDTMNILNIPATIIYYRALDQLPGKMNPIILEIQKENFLKGIWLEDEEILKNLKLPKLEKI